MISAKYRTRPIRISIIFNFFTLLLYFFGAYNYTYRNTVFLILFFLIANTMMYLGFAYGTQRAPIDYDDRPLFPISKFISLLFWISLVMCVPKFIIYTGFYNFSATRVIQSALGFFQEASIDSYLARNTMQNAAGIWRYINYINVLCGPFMWAYNILGLYYWKQLSTGKKIGSIFIWGIYLLSYVCTSTNVGFFDFFLTLMIVLIIKNWKKNADGTNVRRKKGRIIIISIAVFYLLGFIFSFIMLGRSGGNELSYLRAVRVAGEFCQYRRDNMISQILPPAYRSLFAYLTRYLGQPYNALALSFDVNYVPSFGVGYSWFLMDNLGPLKTAAWSSTYNKAIENAFGYGYYANWHTAYLWFANDVSHIGVPILFFFLFSYCGRHWRRFWETNDMMSFLTFMLFVKMMIYMSANNQVFQNSDTFIAFWILFFYVHSKRKWNWNFSMERI